MTALVYTGWVINALAALWILCIAVEILFGWIWGANQQPGLVGFYLVRLANQPVNFMRRVFPTVYRRIDFAPWLTLVMLVLLKTFVIRALLYWAILHQGNA